MSVSKIDICNMSLAHLGMRGITSLTASTNNPSVIACNKFYDPSRDDVFSNYRWPFATVRGLLAESSSSVLGWDYVYAYPARAATVWAVFDEATVDNKEEQEFETIFIPSINAKVLCSNKATAYAEYTYIVEDTTIFSPNFILAFSYKLGAAMAITLTVNQELGLALATMYAGMISEAKRIGWSERIKIPSQTSSYKTARG